MAINWSPHISVPNARSAPAHAWRWPARTHPQREWRSAPSSLDWRTSCFPKTLSWTLAAQRPKTEGCKERTSFRSGPKCPHPLLLTRRRPTIRYGRPWTTIKKGNSYHCVVNGRDSDDLSAEGQKLGLRDYRANVLHFFELSLFKLNYYICHSKKY